MLLNMGSDASTKIALVVASLEEALSRGFIVEIDAVLRRWTNKPPLEGNELRLQRLVWMSDANLSSIAEFTAILTTTFAQVILQRHALVLALGYDAPDANGSVLNVAAAFAQLMLEVVLEVMVDATVMFVEHEHGVPVLEYFVRSNRVLPLLCMASTCISMFVLALYGFMRVPTFTTCPKSAFVCDCVERPEYIGWYTEYCAAVVSVNASAQNRIVAIDLFANVDPFLASLFVCHLICCEPGQTMKINAHRRDVHCRSLLRS